MYATKLLVEEHENVLRLCSVMRAACLNALDEGTVHPADFTRFLRIIREYADRHHHGKEEQLLFKEMEAWLGSPAQKLVRGGMLVEHDLGRLYALQMEEAVATYERSSSKDSLLDILTSAMAYANLLRRHIERENQVVYRFAEKNLPSEVQETLDAQTWAFEQQAKESGFLVEILDELKQLEQAYGV